MSRLLKIEKTNSHTHTFFGAKKSIFDQCISWVAQIYIVCGSFYCPLTRQKILMDKLFTNATGDRAINAHKKQTKQKEFHEEKKQNTFMLHMILSIRKH